MRLRIWLAGGAAALLAAGGSAATTALASAGHNASGHGSHRMVRVYAPYFET